MHKHPKYHIINLSNAIEKLTKHKNTNNIDGIWFDRYIAFLTALRDNQYFKE